MEDVYYVNVDNIPRLLISKLANPKWIDLHRGIPVDKCIGKEIEKLIQSGVITVGSCCGHGQDQPSILIAEESVEKSRSLGYDPRELSKEHTISGVYEIIPKSV